MNVLTAGVDIVAKEVPQVPQQLQKQVYQEG
jgi:hypothetical protein